MTSLKLVVLAVAVLFLAGANGLAQGAPPTDKTPETPVGTVPPDNPAEDPPVEDPPADRPDDRPRGRPDDLPERPENVGPPDQGRPGEGLRDLVDQFQQDREAILAERMQARQSLRERLREASGEEKQQILDELREQHRAWLEEHKARREEVRARIREMIEEFRNRERGEQLEEIEEEIEDAREGID